MRRDYSGRTGRDETALVRTLCALIAGGEASPPASGPQQALLVLARAHRVEGLAVWRIRARGDNPNSWFGDVGGERWDEPACAALDAVRVREVASVIERLAAVEGAAPVVFKGAALAHTHYPHPWLRPRLDTDILISPSRSVPAFAALETLGYRREPAISGELVISQAAFSRTDRFGVDHALDVHWRIANWQVVAAVLSHSEIAARAVPVPALGPHARAAAPADALLLACLHRAAHHRDSEELLWIYDIHLLASGLSEAEWRHVTAVARRGAVTSLCARGIALAIDRFGTFVPGDVLRELEAQPGAPPEPSAVYLSKHLRLVDGLLSDLRALSTRQRARLVAEHLFPPAAYMRQRYGARSRMSMTVSYIRRIASGLPRWFAPGGDR